MSKMKLQNIQIALYFDSDINSEVFWICKDLLGNERNVQPVLFPFGQNPLPQSDMIMAVVPTANGAQIQIGASFVTISANNVKDAFATSEKILRVFSSHNIGFYRIGVITNFSFPNEKIKSLNKKIFNKDSSPEMDFQYAKLSMEDIKSASLKANLWRRYFTALEYTPDLLAETDINTLISEKYQIDQNFLANFIKASQEISKKCFKEDDAI